MTSKLVVNTIEADTGISSVSFASSISMDSTSKFHFSAAGVDIGADTNINRPAAGVLGFNISGAEKVRIDTNGHIHGVGVVTATHFYGNGANLTSLPAQATIANNADNRVITGGSGVNLNGEANLTFDGTNLTLQGGKIYGEDNASNSLHLQSTSGNNNHSRIEIGTIQSSDNGGIHFYTAGSSAATRYMTLKGTSGNLGIGADNPTKKLTVQAGSNNTDIALFTGNDLNRGLLISTIAANSQNDMGVVYHAHGQHGGSYLGEHIFKTNNAERLRIASDGDVGIDINAPVARLQVNSTRNAETDRHSAANYHLALRNPADDNGESIGLSFGKSFLLYPLKIMPLV